MKEFPTLEEFQSIQERRAAPEEIVRAVMARVPPGWTLLHTVADGGVFRRGGIQVILTVSYELDHKLWVHVSASGQRCLPSWEEIKRVKHDFIGPGRWAYQVFPSEADYVNLNPHVLHLFSLLEGEPALPDFTSGTGSI